MNSRYQKAPPSNSKQARSRARYRNLGDDDDRISLTRVEWMDGWIEDEVMQSKQKTTNTLRLPFKSPISLVYLSLTQGFNPVITNPYLACSRPATFRCETTHSPSVFSVWSIRIGSENADTIWRNKQRFEVLILLSHYAFDTKLRSLGKSRSDRLC